MNNLREFQPQQIQADRSMEEVIDLRQYWNIINRRKWPIISLALVVSITAVLVVFAMTPIYQASSTLLIESQGAKTVSIEEVYGLDTRAQTYYQTQFEILKSRPLAERVIDHLALTEHKEFQPEPGYRIFNLDFGALMALMPFNIPAATSAGRPAIDPTIDAIKAYMDDLSIAPVRKTQLVHVHYQSAYPQLAAAIANSHANAYIESMMDARVDMSQSASSWMTRRLDDLKLALAESEQKLQAFREREKLVDLEGLQSLPAKEINELSTRLIEVRRELAQAKNAYFQVRQLRDAPISALSAVPAVLNDSLVQRFRQAGAEAESKVAELGKRYGPKHPKMIGAQSELAAANASLAQQIGRVTGSIKTKYADAQDQERELGRSLERAKNQYHDIGRKESNFRTLQQEVESNRQLYDMFYNRIQETAQTDDLQTANARVISPAIAPSEPVKPKKKLIVMLAFALSVMLGIIAAFMLEALNNTVKSAEDIEQKLKQAMLGMLPLVKLKNKKASTGHLFFDPKQQGFAEAVRTVRTGLSLSNLDTPHKTILVTSSVSGEGKSTTALNLAYAFGQVEKVLLIDADMRRPSIAKTFAIKRDHLGLSELTAGTAQLNECVIHRAEENIDVLIAGMIPANPSELLAARKLHDVLNFLREHYDRIIIDAPPLLPVADARMLSTHADSVVYVVKADATSVKQVKTGLELLHNINAPVTGIVLAQLDIRKAEKYSDYGYGNYYESYESYNS